jgi:diaminopimelate epimerase
MQDPSDITSGVQVNVEGGSLVGYVIDTGAPHVVFFQDDVESTDVASLGKKIRQHEKFQPGGTNVDFVQVCRDDALRIRTYERGVEAETLACGTGAVACAIIASVEKQLSPPIQARVQSGEELRVQFERRPSGISHVVLEGSAHMLFAGTLTYNADTASICDMLQPPHSFHAD